MSCWYLALLFEANKEESQKTVQGQKKEEEDPIVGSSGMFSHIHCMVMTEL